MDTQNKLKPVAAISEVAVKTDNLMQERFCGEVSESLEVTAEAAFTARRLETPGEAGPVFVP